MRTINFVSIPQAVSTVATTALRLEEFMNLFLRFNTVNGKCYCFITSVFPSLWSGTRDVRASSSLCSSAASHPSSHTANGKYCCNLLKPSTKLVTLVISFNTVNGQNMLPFGS